MAANDRDSDAAARRPRSLLFVDHPNLIVMETTFGRSITPARLMSLAKTRGDVVYARVFSDRERMRDPRLIRDWEHADFYIEYCRRYGRPNAERTDQRQSSTKESVDVTLIEYAHRLVDLARPDEVILVAGDSDYLPLVKTLVQTQNVAVRVFLTAPCALMEPQFENRVLTEAYALYDTDTPIEISTIPLYTRMAIRPRDIYELSERDQEELNRLSDALVICPTCEARVEIGLWKTHGCHPNPAKSVRLETNGRTTPWPIQVPATPRPDSTHVPDPTTPSAEPVSSPSVSLKAGSAERLWTGSRQPTTDGQQSIPAAPSPSAPDPLILDQTKWAPIRQATRAIPRSEFQEIAAALKEASSEAALTWLVDDERVSRTQDEVIALKRLIEKQTVCPITVWQRVLLRIRDELTEPETVADVAGYLAAWAGDAMFDEAAALLIDEGVLQVTEERLITRGSLVRPAFRFAGHRFLTEALGDAKATS